MRKTYFHLTHPSYKPGDVKEPSFGDKVLADPQMTKDDPLREHYRERVRQARFTDKPSRLKSNFVFESLNDAREYRASSRRLHDVIYEVEFVDETKAMHRACCTQPWDRYEGGMLDHEAHMYWHKPETYGIVEVFAESDLRIITQVEPPESADLSLPNDRS
jgi:hypothetical protein